MSEPLDPPPLSNGLRVGVVIPALDEEEGIVTVLRALPRDGIDRVVVVDNGSTDRTAERARAEGADVVHEPRRGYGAACHRGIEALGARPDVIVFLDADAADDPAELPSLVEPIADGRADLVIGSRVLGDRQSGALTPHARFGNRLAVALIRATTGVRFTDLGPFRAIRRESLELLQMRDRGFGWTVEMQMRAAQAWLRCREIPVSYRRRIGRSKISGTVLGSYHAGRCILGTIARCWWEHRSRSNRSATLETPQA